MGTGNRSYTRYLLTRLLALALLAWSLPVLAADLMQFYRQAQAHDAQYLSALHQLDAARNAYRQLRAQLLPSLSVGADVTRSNSAGNSDGYNLSLNQPLLDAPAMARWRKGRHQLLQAEADYAAAHQGLIIRVAQAYFDALTAQDELALAEAEKRALAEQLELVKQRLRVGLGTLTEVHETQARYDQSLANELLARNVLNDRMNALYEIAPTQDSYLLPLKQKIPLLGPEPATLDHWLQQGRERNPQLQAAIEAEAAAKAEYDARLAGYLPNIDLSASRGQDNGVSQDKLSVELSMPLYEGGARQAAVGEARDLWLAAQAQRQQQERAMERQVRQAFYGLQAGILRVQALQQALVSSQNALDATIAGMEVGTRTNIDVLNARQELFRTRRNYARSRYDYLMYRLQLFQAIGNLNEDELLAINQWIQP